MKIDSVKLAAQADLVLITVEMLQSPLLADAAESPWYELPSPLLDDLLQVALGRTADNPEEPAKRPSPRAAFADVVRCGRKLEKSAWCDEYSRLFDGAVACPLNQASYIRRDKGKILGDLCGFYRAFGFQSGSKHGERPDHLLCQLEFVAMLLALASRAPDEASYEIVTEALGKYTCDHVHDWLPAACWMMCEETQLEYFAAVAQWVTVLWHSLTELHNWPIDPLPEGHLKPIVDPEDPYECGAPDLHQIQT
ncbi:Nitrate reductase delta subunit [Novipirellula aureliae]|uniref:Nitrate reductase delta subunit n=1 Tax=Novipirellula aureliae TaxID=2527966 RepID=A0A5C6EAE7_9BACT|nr:molecular chaperone TorD family protein [Novipirellula aureliae]TWU45828.1 Nitrate reductase delta subunit [Novipirellula aureliae]